MLSRYKGGGEDRSGPPELPLDSMRVSPELDARVRADLSGAYQQAPDVLDLGVADNELGVWRVAAGAPATSEPLVETGLWMYLAAEVDGGTNLPLSQARTLLTDAAGALVALGQLTLEPDTSIRFASIGTLARSATERASTALWVLSGGTAEQRLRRALLIEIQGLEFLLRYLPEARTNKSAGDLQHARDTFLRIADSEAGGYELTKKSMINSVGGETWPGLTALVTAAASRGAYAELSVHTHPTGYLHVASTEWSGGGNGQVVFQRKSTLHDEARLCEPAVFSFAQALSVVAYSVGCTDEPMRKWCTAILDLWSEWCSANGCR